MEEADWREDVEEERAEVDCSGLVESPGGEEESPGGEEGENERRDGVGISGGPESELAPESESPAGRVMRDSWVSSSEKRDWERQS
jgi:hypothetical protein